jgi:hypothetical protein
MTKVKVRNSVRMLLQARGARNLTRMVDLDIILRTRRPPVCILSPGVGHQVAIRGAEV